MRPWIRTAYLLLPKTSLCVTWHASLSIIRYMNECVKKHKQMMLLQKLRENACCSKSGMAKCTVKKRCTRREILLSSREATFSEHDFSPKLAFFCACAKLLLAIWRHYPLPILFHLPFFRECMKEHM